MNGLDARGHFPIQLCQKGDAFPLPLALGRCGIHVPGARVTAGKQMQCAFASLFVLDPHRPARLRGQGRCFAGAWLQTRFLVDAQPHFPSPQRARVKGGKLGDWGSECGIPGHSRRQPQVMAPRFQLVVRQNPLDRLGRDRLYDSIAHQLSGQCRTLPLRQRPPYDIGPFTRQFDDRQRHRWGKKRACGPDVVCRTAPRYQRPQSAPPICGHAAHAIQPVWRWLQSCARLPATTWPVPGWPSQPGVSVAGATLPRWHMYHHVSQDGSLSYAPA